MRLHAGGMPLLTDLCLAMSIDPLVLIRGVSEFVTVVQEPVVTFGFPYPSVGLYRRTELQLCS